MFVCCRFSCNVMGNKFYSDCRFRIPLQIDYIGYGRSGPWVTPSDRGVGQCGTPITTHRCGSVTKCRPTDREIGRLTFTAIESSSRDPGMLITIPETADCHYCRQLVPVFRFQIPFHFLSCVNEKIVNRWNSIIG